MFENYLRVIALISFPVMTLLIGLARPIVSILLTDKWLPAVFFVQVLGFGYMLDPIMRFNAISLSIQGKSSYNLYSEILKKCLMLLILIISISFGLRWITIGAAIYSVVDIAVVTIFTKRVAGVGLMREFRVLLPQCIYAIISMAFLFIIQRVVVNDWICLIIGIPGALLIYLGMVAVFSNSLLKKIKRVLFHQ